MDTKSVESLIGRELAETVRRRGFTLRDASRAAAYSQNYLSNVLGGNQDLKFRHVLRVLGGIGESPARFFTRVASLLHNAEADRGDEIREPTQGERWPGLDYYAGRSGRGEGELDRGLIREMIREELDTLSREGRREPGARHDRREPGGASTKGRRESNSGG